MMAVDLHKRESLYFSSQIFSEQNESISQNWPSRCTSYDLASSLNSPVVSELGFTESLDTDQDDDYIAELTRQMAHHMLQDDDNKHEASWCLSQSTLSSYSGRSRKEFAFRRKFEEPKIIDEFGQNNYGESVSENYEPLSSVILTARNQKSCSLDFRSKQALIEDQIRAIQMKQEKFVKQRQEAFNWRKQANGSKQPESKHQLRQFQNKGKAGVGFGTDKQKLSWANLNLQQQNEINGSEMRAIFLGESGTKRASCGTGVFLPRNVGNFNKSRKKPGCSTVLIPARVIQALKLQFDKMGVPSRANGVSFLLQHDSTIGDVCFGLQSQHKSQMGRRQQ
ncbi:hypothetical protein K2173_016589 [Erythroxylum novogranatense]|uniref:Uncharacterized protein n=1 Tax=Erythroxylum novogranatense TaxID=1862640 RepID=A0AAV8SGY7_9ROSI|nr:hypothetical protein K2173_016589 [Erythroxylum novogranatense]